MAATEEGGGSDGGREKDERVTREIRERKWRCSTKGVRSHGCSGRRWSEGVMAMGAAEREESTVAKGRGKKKRKGAREFCDLIKLYGLSSIDNRGI